MDKQELDRVEANFEHLAIEVANKEGWHFKEGEPLMSEGGLAVACYKAGYENGAAGLRRLQEEVERLKGKDANGKTPEKKAQDAFVSVANGLCEALDTGNWDLVYGVWRNIADVLIGVKPELEAEINPISVYGLLDRDLPTTPTQQGGNHES